MARYRVAKISHVPPGEMVAHFADRRSAIGGLHIQRVAEEEGRFDWGSYWMRVRTPYQYPTFWCIRRIEGDDEGPDSSPLHEGDAQ